jgi:hypothetical protein
MAATDILLQFGAQIITEEGAKIIKNLDFLYHPAEGYVSFYNATDNYFYVETLDEKIRYEERRIAPREVVRLTARGNMIHIRVRENGATYDCDKQQAYLFDGQNTYVRTA